MLMNKYERSLNDRYLKKKEKPLKFYPEVWGRDFCLLHC